VCERTSATATQITRIYTSSADAGNVCSHFVCTHDKHMRCAHIANDLNLHKLPDSVCVDPGHFCNLHKSPESTPLLLADASNVC